MSIYLYLFSFYFLWIIQSSTCDICSTCSCSVPINKGLQINCHEKHLRNNDMLNFDLLTLNNYQVLNKLILSKNDIVNLSKHLFKKFTFLKSLDLSENIMEEIHTSIFMDLNNLQDLNLSQNILRSFDDSLLEVLPALLTLDLSYNNINSIEHIMNKTTTKISTLNLSHNNISSLPEQFSKSLVHLQYLDLSFNRIHFLQECNLIHLTSLKVIYINNNFFVVLNMHILPKTLVELHSGYNQITKMPYNMHYIQILNIEYNKIFEIDANLTTDSLKYLNISGNMLSSFPNMLFENLEVLDISNNKLTYIPEVVSVKNFPVLIYFDVSKNPIQNLTICSDLKLNLFIANNMDTLKTIDKNTLINLRSPVKDCINLTISNNKMLSFIHEDALTHMNLCSLDLSNNQFSYVAQKLTLHNGTSTTCRINLQGNPFKCNCALQWMLNDLVPKLYSTQPHLLADLRCSWPPQISNMRMVHWYGWKDQIFCTNNSVFNENILMNAAGVTTHERIELNSSPGLLVALAITTTVLTILIMVGIIWTQRIIIKKRRVNRKF